MLNYLGVKYHDVSNLLSTVLAKIKNSKLHFSSENKENLPNVND